MQTQPIDPRTVPFVTVEELAVYARMPRRTLYHHVAKGALAAIRRGRRVYIAQGEAIRYLSSDSQAVE